MAVELREARSGDEMAVAEVHVRSWQEAYREIMPGRVSGAAGSEERAARYEFENGERGADDVVAGRRGGGRGAPLLTNSGEVRSGILGFATFGRFARRRRADGLARSTPCTSIPDRYEGGSGARPVRLIGRGSGRRPQWEAGLGGRRGAALGA